MPLCGTRRRSSLRVSFVVVVVVVVVVVRERERETLTFSILFHD